jgi:hypothetical protein
MVGWRQLNHLPPGHKTTRLPHVFLTCSIHARRYPCPPPTREDIEPTLSYGLRFSTTGRPHRHGYALGAAIAAGIIVDHLDRSGFVLMKKPPAWDGAALAQGGSKHLTE